MDQVHTQIMSTEKTKNDEDAEQRRHSRICVALMLVSMLRITNCTKQPTATLEGSIIKHFQSGNIISSIMHKNQEHLYSPTYSSKSERQET